MSVSIQKGHKSLLTFLLDVILSYEYELSYSFQFELNCLV